MGCDFNQAASAASAARRVACSAFFPKRSSLSRAASSVYALSPLTSISPSTYTPSNDTFTSSFPNFLHGIRNRSSFTNPYRTRTLGSSKSFVSADARTRTLRTITSPFSTPTRTSSGSTPSKNSPKRAFRTSVSCFSNMSPMQSSVKKSKSNRRQPPRATPARPDRPVDARRAREADARARTRARHRRRRRRRRARRPRATCIAHRTQSS
ncbi:hypothetical protein BE221DRAFT_165205 [Ostreococcus tauri]|uniref:Uncharacterized protein n=1 Tax=Ostreococcus tauri TaxID=70448 RepID=A0A1Y5II23_OSTTA|nr:hypothetical protein BE221DRAFT_165205 [Ostreococcus tauri]